MGLDNFPTTLPCKHEGTAVYGTAPYAEPGEDPIVDCDATQAVGGCPWKRQYDEDQPGTPILGMFGAPCWYRGKAGEGYVRLADLDDEYTFFGNQDNEPNLPADYCLNMAEELLARRDAVKEQLDSAEELQCFDYAVWWLTFVAQYGGAEAWW